MALDFRATQVRTNKIIASGSTGTNASLLIYPFSSALNLSGGLDPTKFITGSIGQDAFLYVSGAIGSLDATTRAAVVLGGDLHISGNLRVAGTLTATIPGSASGSIFVTSGAQAYTTSSVAFDSSTRYPSQLGSDVFFFVSGGNNASARFDGKIMASGGIRSVYNAAAAIESINVSGTNTFALVTGLTAPVFGNVTNTVAVGDFSQANGVVFVGASRILGFLSSSNSFFSASIQFPLGLSGSLQRLVDGTPFLVPGDNVTITTQSNGAIAISASSGGATITIGANAVAFGSGSTVTGSANFSFLSSSNLLSLSGTLFASGAILAKTSATSITAGNSASIILGFDKGVFAEDSTNAQRRVVSLTASNILLFGDGNLNTHLSASSYDIYTASTRRFRISSAGAVSLGAITDSGIGGTLTLNNNTPIYFLDSGNTARSILSLDGSNRIVIGESATGLNQVKFSGQTVGVYVTLSRSFTVAIGDDEIGNALGKPTGTFRAADQPAGSVSNIFGAGLVIRNGRGTGTGVTSSVLVQGTVVTGSGTNQHALRDIAQFHGSYGFQLSGIASASLPTASSLFSGSIQATSDTGQLWYMSGSTWKELGRNPSRIFLAGALTSYATGSAPAMIGQFEFNPADFDGGPRGIFFRAILSVVTGVNVTGSVALWNVTSGAFVEFSPGTSSMGATSSTPALFTSSDLRNAVNFATGSAIYEVRMATSNALSASTIGIAEMIIK